MTLLSSLIEGSAYKLTGRADIDITGITYHSKKVCSGYIFVCLQGQHTDGARFVSEAVTNGAAAIVTDRELDDIKDTVQIVVPNALKALSFLSAKYYDFPSKKLNVIGVTGTNGKTTITYLLESIFETAGMPASVIGTINYRFGKEIISPDTTTPLSSDLQFLLDKAVKKQIKTVLMEVSSHALSLNRVDFVEFDAAIFTNLTRDHLDFHKTFEEYFAAKLKLFKLLEKEGEKDRIKFAIINNDDTWGEKIPGLIKCKAITCGLSQKSDVYPAEIRYEASGTSFDLHSGDLKLRIKSELIGKHNIYNILAACACALNFGIMPESIVKGIENLKSVPGRLEKVDCGQPFTIVVDYAHTDDALKNVLTTLKEIVTGKIITLFGCGGDRDRSKRPIMGETAVTLSDYAIVTSDNPRSENPEKIVFDIEVGIRRAGKENYEIQLDRKEAIKRALQIAKKNDIVLLAGKGHENYQIIGQQKIHFSDREVVENELLNGLKKWKKLH
ncbi:MAG: UDP-N-acetylmuramoyl-L-alanyl-D-glutamate--2,6-diaminopimelate ligase [Elusimicrobia bacterium]|nr:UDP-N-acetylmuramoyl-L-alanyl-D-glutamate--2,6-diaminopimelate ligase [Elusimicrobiota bacterium]MBU2614519.1 UDP-N-acetylmuramoyl-L-alanyl-D-glutamate--2,6-diaminopimelate ligase [Elusimicrobiota bacterium]